MGEINLAIVGIGNCASSLVQALAYYEDVDDGDDAPGLRHPRLAGYRVDDVEVVCGFDVDERKVGRDVAEAIFADPNNATRAVDDLAPLDAPVYRAPVEDGVPDLAREDGSVRVAEADPVDLATKLDEHGVDVLVNLLPPGSTAATETWMRAALETGTAVVNAPPDPVAGDRSWAKRFADAGVPVLGDDVRAQLGPTAAHQALTRAMREGGVDPEHTYQLNVAGNPGLRSLQDRDRRAAQQESATEAVRRELGDGLGDGDVKAGPTDHVPFLGDEKLGFLRLEGRGFLDTPVELEVRLSVEDAPHAAATLLDAVRVAKAAHDEGHAGPVEGPSRRLFKAPPDPEAPGPGGDLRAALEDLDDG
jgi:myo-inositol-1-phosphate synthase